MAWTEQETLSLLLNNTVDGIKSYKTLFLSLQRHPVSLHFRVLLIIIIYGNIICVQKLNIS